MSSGLKWCEWCYSSLSVSSSECANCDSSSFVYQDPRKPKLLRDDAIKRREGKQYDERPRSSTSTAWDSSTTTSNSESSSVLSRRILETGQAKQEPALSAEDHALNAEIAEIVVQIELLDRKLQSLLSRKSSDIRKLNEVRDRAVTANAVKAAAATSVAASSISDALGELFGN